MGPVFLAHSHPLPTLERAFRHGKVRVCLGYDPGMTRTATAFRKVRLAIGSARVPPQGLIANQDQLKPMTAADGLMQWQDGVAGVSVQPGAPPLLEQSDTQDAHLWVVRTEDVVHAEERCAFGTQLASRVVKHTNLTGGAAAFCGGELLFLTDGTIVVNGCSGRYGPRSKAEMDQVVTAFVGSGYGVWSMGFDEETNRPIGFVGALPEWAT